MGIQTRAAGPADESLLREYLWLSIFVAPGAAAPSPSIVDRPEIAAYVDGWGRYGDDGVVAIDTATGADVGAAWLRLWLGPDTGYGYVDRSTPELAIAVRPDARGRGIGTCLLDTLLERASTRYRAVSLSVTLENPAVALYQRHGFRAITNASGTLTMRLTFTG